MGLESAINGWSDNDRRCLIKMITCNSNDNDSGNVNSDANDGNSIVLDLGTKLEFIIGIPKHKWSVKLNFNRAKSNFCLKNWKKKTLTRFSK